MVTRYESFSSLSAACDPIYPAPPVTNTCVTPSWLRENCEEQQNYISNQFKEVDSGEMYLANRIVEVTY